MFHLGRFLRLQLEQSVTLGDYVILGVFGIFILNEFLGDYVFFFGLLELLVFDFVDIFLLSDLDVAF